MDGIIVEIYISCDHKLQRKLEKKDIVTCLICLILLHFLLYNTILLVSWEQVINNYWMRLSMISRIIQTEVNVICRSEAEADNIDRGLNNS